VPPGSSVGFWDQRVTNADKEISLLLSNNRLGFLGALDAQILRERLVLKLIRRFDN
jgi:hypothetical protein